MEQEEIWKDIPGYEGSYQASTYGRIKSLNRTIIRNKVGSLYIKEKILKQYIQINKLYYQINLRKDNKRKTYGTYRLIALTFLGLDIENKKSIVMHIDDNGFNNNITNLKLGTILENVHDCINKGRNCFGERQGNSKLKSIDIKSIFNLYQIGYSQTYIAKMFNVHQCNISRILHKKRWGCLIIN